MPFADMMNDTVDLLKADGTRKTGLKASVQKSKFFEEAKSADQSITYNINGNNARVNHSSIDNSINVIQVDVRAIQYIEALRSKVDGSGLSTLEKAEANEVIDEVETAQAKAASHCCTPECLAASCKRPLYRVCDCKLGWRWRMKTSPSIERTCPGKTGYASHVKHYAS